MNEELNINRKERGMTDLFHRFAIEYAKETGCDKATAKQASFVAATLIADLMGKKEIGNYFSRRASEMELKKDGETFILFNSKNDIDLNDISYIVPANEQFKNINKWRDGWY